MIDSLSFIIYHLLPMPDSWQNDKIANHKRQRQQDNQESDGIQYFGMSSDKSLDETSHYKNRYRADDNLHPPLSSSSERNHPSVGAGEQPAIAYRQSCRTRNDESRNLQRAMQENCQEGLIQ